MLICGLGGSRCCSDGWWGLDYVGSEGLRKGGGSTVLVGSFSVSVQWKGVEDGFTWVYSGVYGPNDNNLGSDLWDELVGIQQYWNVPWCCFGDFNVVRFPSEQRGGSRLTPAMEKFSEFIEDLNLIDLPLEGGRFTWSSGTE